MIVSQNIQEILSRATLCGRRLRLGDQLDRATYQAVEKVIAAAGGKWVRKVAGHVFECDAADAIEPILMTGEVSRIKQDFGQFDSPPAVVARVMHLAKIEPGMKVLEPSAGLGPLVGGARACGGNVWAYEIDARRHARLYSEHFTAGGCVCGDFLEAPPAPIFDRVVMNPPFAKVQDGLHVLHALKFLAPGGRLVAVMSASARYRSYHAYSQIQRIARAIDDLPDGSFKSAGTAVRACIATIDV